MSKEAIVERIISDANAEAEAIVQEANKKAEEIVSAASARAEKGRRATETEVQEKTADIFDKKAAAARLDAAKILLSEKRGVIDAAYAEAKKRLISLNKEECLALTDRLLKEYADENDEIVFAEKYPYADDASRLPVIGEKKLKIPEKRAKIDGGFMLCGLISDKDLSFDALLQADRDEYQAEIAAELFKTK